MNSKIKIILMLILTNIIYANNIPINISFNYSNGINVERISDKEIKNADFQDFVTSKDLGNIVMDINSFGVNVKYKYNEHKFGAGLDFLIQKKFNKLSLKEEPILTNENLEKYLQINNNIGKLEEEQQKYQYLRDINRLKKESEDKEISNHRVRLNKFRRNVALINEEMEKEEYNTPEKRRNIKNMEDEAFKRAEKFSEEEKKLAERYREIDSILKDTSLEETKKEELEKEKKEVGTKLEEAHRNYILSLRDRQKYLNLGELIGYDDPIAENQKKIDKENEEIEKHRKLKDESDEEYRLYKAKVRTLNRKINEEESNLEELNFKINENQKIKAYNILVDTLNKEDLIYGGIIYLIYEYNKNLEKDLKFYLNTNLGVKLEENILLKSAYKIQEEGIIINNKKYQVPQNISKVKVLPYIEMGVGLKYKGLKTGIFSSFGKGIIGVNLGYEY